ncbi:MAG: hypothetical protein Q4F95_02855 [Oscillospiraceae bacterium]|nr:hypothetical protein [Oscillospiraceae bacterium]
MRFDDEYRKDMDNKKLSDEFIKKLSAKMDAQAGDGNDDPCKYLDETEEMTEEAALVKIHDERRGRIMIRRITAAAAAAVVVFGGAIAAIYKNRPDIEPGDNTYDTSITSETLTDVTVTTISVQTKQTTKSVTGTTSLPVTTNPDNAQTTKVTAADNNSQTEVNFASKDELVNFVNARTAENSPLATSYEAAGYDRIYSQFYNVSFTDSGYRCTVSDSEARRGLAGYWPVYYEDSYDVMQATSDKLNEDDLDDFSRIISYINKTAGRDNYYIHDIYKYDISRSYYQVGSDVTEDTEKKPNYCVEIVLKDYYEQYKLYNYNKEDFVVSYALEHTHIVDDATQYDGGKSEKYHDNVVLTEYPYFNKTQELCRNFLNEFNSLYSDYAVTIGNVSYKQDYTIDGPFTSWVRNTVQDDVYFRYHIDQYLVPACAENESPDFSETDMRVCLYFKPGTDESFVDSCLNHMKPLFDKYNINFMTTDVLTDQSDFDRIKNSGGYIPDMQISSSSSAPSLENYIERYHNKGNDFQSWSSK